MEYIVKLENLTKQYGKHVVVDRVNLAIEKGHIYGLIGPNGAGKTTIMRMLAGLTEPSGGEMELFGDRTDLDDNRNRISFMIEAPYLDGGMTARENMEYIRFVRGVAEENRIDELLELVGLGTVGKKLVEKFSLGMKPRLSNPAGGGALQKVVNGARKSGVEGEVWTVDVEPAHNTIKLLCPNETVRLSILPAC